MMKLTNREKMLLMVLGICVLLASLYYAVIRPQLNFVANLEKQATEYSQVIKGIKLKASADNPIYKEYKVVNAKVQGITVRYYPSIIQEKILLTIDNIIKDSGLKVSSITFTEPASIQLNKGQAKVEATQENKLQAIANHISGSKQTAEKQEKPSVKAEALEPVEGMTVSVAFEGTYSQFYSMVSSIEKLNRSIVINEVKIASNRSESLAGTMLLDIYAIPKPFNQDQEYLNWNSQGEYGKADPFGYMQSPLPAGTIAGGPSSVLTPSITSIAKRDFFISIRPISSDLPSVIIGKYDDRDRSTYVYADNLGYENVELQIVQDGDRFYYGYKTQDYSYPSGYSKNLVEFKPLGDELQLAVLSSNRNKDKDVNGVKLSVINKTQLPLKIYIANDDKSFPRLKLDKLEGSISAIQE